MMELRKYKSKFSSFRITDFHECNCFSHLAQKGETQNVSKIVRPSGSNYIVTVPTKKVSYFFFRNVRTMPTHLVTYWVNEWDYVGSIFGVLLTPHP